MKLDSVSLIFRFGKAAYGITLNVRRRMQSGRTLNIVRIVVGFVDGCVLCYCGTRDNLSWEQRPWQQKSVYVCEGKKRRKTSR